MNHNGFQYKLGLNIDTREFNPKGTCQEGGLYYTTKEHLHKYLEYGCFIADIQIPDDAKVYADPDGDKLKADRIIITRIMPLQEHKIGKQLLRLRSSESQYKNMMKYKRFKCQRKNSDNIYICNRRADICDSCGLRICTKCREEISCPHKF